MFAALLTRLAPFALYLKLAVIAALVAGAVWVTWELRGADIEKEKQKAVTEAVLDMTQQYNQEREWRLHYQAQADKFGEVLTAINNIKIEHKTVTNNIIKEIERDPKFYGQALPEGGRKAWMDSRALVEKAVQGQK